ncbi:M12 family metallo-peptidase [Thalassotalea fonticola]|uniref:M12 family metallo-peptidase n=1 Tax=Thalassotalea fonticola TaxID=3065649 RepID=A0ABZ0GTD4_9GAMM|nr:M12 family metallo-peptidase [Colwelliaceae bacterium S1-1]
MTLSKLLKNVTIISAYMLYAFIVDAYAAQSMWQDVSFVSLHEDNLASKKVIANRSRLLELNTSLIQHKLQQSQKTITLPMPDGDMVEFILTETDVLPASLAAKYPTIKTYKGVQVGNDNNYGRLDYTNQGFHAVLRYQNEIIYIDPQQQGPDAKANRNYISYYKKDAITSKSAIETQVLSSGKTQPYFAQKLQDSASGKSAQHAGIDKVYRIAFATSGEYSQFHGGNKAEVLSAITTMVNRLNQVFSIELGITLQLAEHNDDVIYLNADTDPFVNTDMDVYNNPQVLREQLGNDSFDIGHVLTTGAGGLAVVAATCDNDTYIEDDQEYFPIKAMGVTGSISPINDSFYIDFVAHELGHQLGAEHTFNGQSESCWGGNREYLSAVEPGSGSTIMSYAGLCGSENLQASVDDYFHVRSIEQMKSYLTDDPWQIGQSCGTNVASTNTPPSVDAGDDYVIPAQTPFTLSAIASDDEGNTLTYSFEQVDLGTASYNLDDMKDDGLKPLFRSFKPSELATRTFPQLTSILSGDLVIGENFASTNRDLNFNISVRDGQGAISTDSVKLTVLENSVPFQLTSPTQNDIWFAGETNNIYWDIANTADDEINCQAVDIELSTDGGLTFGHTLLGNTANNGMASIIGPKLNTEQARLKISCVNNIFFAISADDFQLSSNVAPIANSDRFDVDADSQQLFDVLANDTDADIDDGISLISVDYQGQGSVSINHQQISYQPATGFSGSESISYQIKDQQGLTATGNVTVNVLAPEKTKAGGGSNWLWLNLLLIISLACRVGTLRFQPPAVFAFKHLLTKLITINRNERGQHDF